MKRRTVLASVGALGVGGIAALSGCSAGESSPKGGGEGDTREVLVNNERDETTVVAVRVEGTDGVFSHVYELGPGEMDQTAGDGEVEGRPGTITAFVPGEETRTWEFASATDLGCDGQDVGVRVRPSGRIEFYTTC